MSNMATEQVQPLPEAPVLTANDRCDRCGAQAWVLFLHTGGHDLLFCNHHFNEHESKLVGQGTVVIDERHRIQ